VGFIVRYSSLIFGVQSAEAALSMRAVSQTKAASKTVIFRIVFALFSSQIFLVKM